jgi:hypothetical protein
MKILRTVLKIILLLVLLFWGPIVLLIGLTLPFDIGWAILIGFVLLIWVVRKL